MLMHRRQSRFRETNSAEEGEGPDGVIYGDTRKRVTGFLKLEVLGDTGVIAAVLLGPIAARYSLHS